METGIGSDLEKACLSADSSPGVCVYEEDAEGGTCSAPNDWL